MPCIANTHGKRRKAMYEKFEYSPTFQVQDGSEDFECELMTLNQRFRAELEGHKEIMSKLARSRGILRSLLDATFHLIFLVDYDGQILAANISGARFLGTTPARAVGHNMKSFLPWREFKLLLLDVHDVLCSQKAKQLEWTFLDHRFDVQAAPVALEFGAAFQAVLVLNNISDLKITAARPELQVHDDNQKAGDAKILFLTSLSHEIRTPLSSIIGLSSLLLDSGLKHEQEVHIRRIIMLSEMLLNQANDILDFSQIESKKYVLSRAEFNLDLALEKIRQSMAFQAQSKGLHIGIHRSPDVPVHLQGDAQCLHQILFNLMDNAVKYTPQGKIETNVYLAQKTQEAVQLRFSIQDTGIGIAEEMQKSIFEPFQHANDESSAQHTGAGLGLFICKRFVDLMSGQIQVKSRPGEGSTFSFTAWFGLVLGCIEPKKDNSANADPTCKNLDILLVEDFEINQEILYHLLSKLGHKVEIRENGVKALSALEERHYDVVLMDLEMPVMDGLETAWHIRRHNNPAVAWIPIIALSAYRIDEELGSAIQSVMNGSLLKPVQPHELQEALHKAINNF